MFVRVKVMSIANTKGSPICLNDLSFSSKAQSTFHQGQQESYKRPKAELDQAF